MDGDLTASVQIPAEGRGDEQEAGNFWDEPE
jgi:hypothetical protein